MNREELEKKLRNDYFNLSYGVMLGLTPLANSRYTGLFEKLLLILLKKVILDRLCRLNLEMDADEKNES